MILRRVLFFSHFWKIPIGPNSTIFPVDFFHMPSGKWVADIVSEKTSLNIVVTSYKLPKLVLKSFRGKISFCKIEFYHWVSSSSRVVGHVEVAVQRDWLKLNDKRLESAGSFWVWKEKCTKKWRSKYTSLNKMFPRLVCSHAWYIGEFNLELQLVESCQVEVV